MKKYKFHELKCSGTYDHIDRFKEDGVIKNMVVTDGDKARPWKLVDIHLDYNHKDIGRYGVPRHNRRKHGLRASTKSDDRISSRRSQGQRPSSNHYKMPIWRSTGTRNAHGLRIHHNRSQRPKSTHKTNASPIHNKRAERNRRHIRHATLAEAPGTALSASPGSPCLPI